MFLIGGAAPLALLAAGAHAQDLQDRATPPPPVEAPTPATPDQVQFSAGQIEYDTNSDVVVATGDVRMFREGQRLRADRVQWDRKSGKVVATGDIAVTNPEGDVAYGDSIELTDSLKDGVVDNMLVVLEQGGRLAAAKGTRETDGTVNLDRAAYTPCAVVDSEGCPKEPSWKITAVKVSYRPDRQRVFYTGSRFHLFGLPTVPLPNFSHPVGGSSDSGLLTPRARLDRVNGLEVVVPYYFRFGQNRGLTISPHIFSDALPMLQLDYRALSEIGAYRLTAYGTYSRRSDDTANSGVPTSTEQAFRGYLDGAGRFQLDPNWSLSGSLRLVTDRTFLRRYDLSREDRLRTNLSIERIDQNSYLSIAGWAVQTLRLNDDQGLQPVALPEIDYRRRFPNLLAGGTLQVQVNSLAIGRAEGQDTQRAFASARWDLRRLTNWGQEVTFTAFARADAYNTNDTLATMVASYRGTEGFETRAIGALAMDVKWPFVGELLGGTQRFTPRLQFVASPKIANLSVPNEDSRAVDLDSSNLFALNRFPGYDRWEDSSRVTYGGEWALDLPAFTFDTVIGQSYRLTKRATILPDGTGLSARFSDVTGRSELRYRDFVSLTHRYRVDKDSFAIRRNEVDATLGSRATYFLLGYLRLNRDIDVVEDLQDREEVRVGGRVAFARFWSVFASAVVDLTDRAEDRFNLSDGFDPVRHRLGFAYEDDCLELGLSWKRDYRTIGDSRRGNSYLLTLSLKNLGR